MRGALRRAQESCLVNAIVLQAWEAAHGRRRDLVVGVTGPTDFHAHAWLQGDPVPPADDAPFDRSVLRLRGGRGSSTQADGSNGTGEPDGDGAATLTSFNELLRRPAPHYPRD